MSPTKKPKIVTVTTEDLEPGHTITISGQPHTVIAVTTFRWPDYRVIDTSDGRTWIRHKDARYILREVT